MLTCICPERVTKEALVKLSSDDLANDAAQREAEKVARESLKNVFKPKDQTKPKEEIKKSPVVQKLVNGDLNNQDSKDTDSVMKASAASLDDILAKMNSVSGPFNSLPTAHKQADPKDSSLFKEQTLSESLDAILAKIDSTNSFPQIDASFGETSEQNFETVWNGSIEMTNVASFSGKGCPIIAPEIPETIWPSIFSQSLSVSGKPH